MKRYDEAIADFTRFLELTAGSSDEVGASNRSMVLVDRARAYWWDGQRDQARADLQRALELDPESAYAREVESHFLGESGLDF